MGDVRRSFHFGLTSRDMFEVTQMRELTWGWSKARIWLNESPGWNYEAARVAERHLLADGMRDGKRRCMAVEMFVPTGPMARYGGLGATFVPEQNENLRVQVLVSAEQALPFPEALAFRSETARIGFPEEYVQGLLEGVAQFEGTPELGTGTLSFCWAIHGEVGSSIQFFQRISRAVIRLLCHQKQALSDEDLLELLR